MEPFIRMENGQAAAMLTIESWRRQFPEIRAGFTTRIGGVSEAPYDSLNGGLHVGDDAGHVRTNRRIIASLAGFAFEDWTCAEQVHGSNVYLVRAGDRGKGRNDRSDAIPDADALVTNVPGVMLASFYADCVPLYFVHPASRTVALAHAGWKGTALRIAEETIRVLQDQFDCAPESLYAAIGPSIGGCCYEIDGEVASRLAAALAGEAAVADSKMEWENPGVGLKAGNDGRYVADLKEINRQIMIKAGIQPTSIEISRYCTSCRTDLFYSHRKEKGKTGRMVSWIGLKEEVAD
ncbi:peptidoglycan editing factor PgeF [Xylanibacillus composti]|nr:peptidoglycan editing factor PgeF [Xylanibacillus composti]